MDLIQLRYIAIFGKNWLANYWEDYPMEYFEQAAQTGPDKIYVSEKQYKIYLKKLTYKPPGTEGLQLLTYNGIPVEVLKK